MRGENAIISKNARLEKYLEMKVYQPKLQWSRVEDKTSHSLIREKPLLNSGMFAH